MNVSQILTGLRAERTRIDQAIAALEKIGMNHGRAMRTPTRSRGAMSAAARKRLSRLLKARWASGKMGKRKSKPA